MNDLKENNSGRIAYWHANIKLLISLLIVWFFSSYLLGIVFVKNLNQIRIGGFKLGFWFAQQGAIYVFILIIFFYVWRMNQLDKQFDVEE